MKLSCKAENNNRWKGENASYYAKHQFLKRNYGSPQSCTLCGLLGYKEKGGRWSIHWAKKTNSEYTHNVEDYMGLCRVCHGKYDWNEEKTQYMIAAARKQKGSHSVAKSTIALKRERDSKGHFIKSALNEKKV